jgi:hypothetical protein
MASIKIDDRILVVIYDNMIPDTHDAFIQAL